MVKILKTLAEWLVYFIFSLIFMLLIGMYVFQTTKVVGISMLPNLQNQQIVYIWKLNHTFSRVPNYGQIVIVDSRVDQERSLKDEFLDSPIGQLFHKSQDHHLWIKRVIAKPGDEVKIRDSRVYLNGNLLEEPYIQEKMLTSSEQKWVIPEGYVFVMGDNRNHSKDSREIGPIPIDHILGLKL